MKWKFWQRDKPKVVGFNLPATEQAQIEELYRMCAPDVVIKIEMNAPVPPEVVAGLLRSCALRFEERAKESR